VESTDNRGPGRKTRDAVALLPRDYGLSNPGCTHFFQKDYR
jgi:hypothetical protein